MRAFDTSITDFSIPIWLVTWIAGAVVLGMAWLKSTGHLAVKVLAGLHLLATPLGVGVWCMSMEYGALLVAGWVYLVGMIAAWSACFQTQIRGPVRLLAVGSVLTALAVLASIGVGIDIAKSLG